MKRPTKKDPWKIDLGLDKINIFNEPKPRKGKGTRAKKPQYKPILTKANQEQAKKIIKETGSAFGKVISNIKNRKIRKLEKEAIKTQEKAEALAHEIKLRLHKKDQEENIIRYQKEIDKMTEEEKPKEKEHSQACKDYNMALENENLICMCEDQT